MTEIDLFWWDPEQMTSELVRLLMISPVSTTRALVGHNLRFQNFGDSYSRFAVEYVMGRKVVWSPPGRAQLFSTGSIMRYTSKSNLGAYVWGSGCRTRDEVPASNIDLKFLCVRGPLTSEIYQTPEVFGDPGLIASDVFSITNETKSKTIFIPHFTEIGARGKSTFYAKLKNAGIEVVLPNQSPKEVSKLVSQSELVITSSLHGLVFADSFGIPRLRLTNESEPTFKYQDYEKSVNTVSDQFRHSDLLKILETHAPLSALRALAVTPDKNLLWSLKNQIVAAASGFQ